MCGTLTQHHDPNPTLPFSHLRSPGLTWGSPGRVGPVGIDLTEHACSRAAAPPPGGVSPIDSIAARTPALTDAPRRPPCPLRRSSQSGQTLLDRRPLTEVAAWCWRRRCRQQRRRTRCASRCVHSQHVRASPAVFKPMRKADPCSRRCDLFCYLLRHALSWCRRAAHSKLADHGVALGGALPWPPSRAWPLVWEQRGSAVSDPVAWRRATRRHSEWDNSGTRDASLQL